MPTPKLNRVIHRLMSCDSLSGKILTAGEYLKNPVILSDLSLHILGITPDDSITDLRWKSLYAGGAMPMNLINTALYRSALESDAPVLSTDSTGLPVVQCAVAHDRRLIGYLLSPCYHGMPTQAELDLMQILADLCSLDMQKGLHPGAYPEDIPEFFVSDLLNGAITDEQQIRDRCSRFGWHLQVPYRLLTIRSADPDKTEPNRECPDPSRQCELLRQTFPEATVFPYGKQIKFIIGIQDETTREQLLLHRIAEFLGQHGLVAGVSQPGRNFHSLYARHHQAMKALQMGTLLRGSGSLYFFDRYSVYCALESCSEKTDLLELCHPAILKLERYDRRHDTAYMGTLHAYLACGKNACEAADALFIHRNTLSKRLEKINDIITVDLNDRETVFHLLFSLRVIEYYGATRLRTDFETWVEKMPTLRHS